VSEIEEQWKRLGLRYLKCDTANECFALNFALPHARAPFVAFLKSGCSLPAEFLLAAHNLFQHAYVGVILPESEPSLFRMIGSEAGSGRFHLAPQSLLDPT